MSARLLSAIAWACLLAAAPVRAGTPPAQDGREVYPPAYFDDVRPANALDMVRRLPGFSLVEADADVRGYAGASGNVLLDGVRPTSKREGTTQLLRRIPAQAVERIEMIHAGVPGVDMGGYPVLANIVRRHDASREWTVQAGVIAATGGWAEPQARLEYGRRRGGHSLDLSLKQVPELDDDSGRGHILTRSADDPGGERVDWDTRTTKRDREATVAWRQPLGSGQLTLEAAMRGERERSGTQMAHAGTVERIDEDADSREYELGARFVRPFGDHAILEVMASQQREHLSGTETRREDADSERFDEDIVTGERIARIELAGGRDERLSFNAGFEAAFNVMESDNRLLENGVPVALPGAQVRIEERRAEAGGGLTWHWRDALALEAGMRLERSRLTQTGDRPRERHFTYPKPRLAVRWTPDAANQWRFALSREVGQLDFADFAASASLEGGTVSAGNAELRPDRSWRSVISLEHHFNQDAALTLGWTHDRITDVVDRVPVVEGGEVFDAPGNIGEGRRDSLSLDLSTSLRLPWLRGVRLRSSLLWRDSAVTDPVTGARRRISGEKPLEGEVELSQDLPTLRLNWGLLLEHIGERKDKYRHDRVTRESEDMGWTLFVERRLGAHWRLRAEATDLFGRDFRQTRDKYAGTRGDGAIEETEIRHRRSPGYVSLTVRRSVGG